MLSDETVARLRAKLISKPVTTPTAEDRASYEAQLRQLGADDALLVRLGLRAAPSRRRWLSRLVR